jgi:hypothetical protein
LEWRIKSTKQESVRKKSGATKQIVAAKFALISSLTLESIDTKPNIMNAFPTDIPQSQPLLSGDGRDVRAPGIVAGEAFADQVVRAALEANTRKHLRDLDPNIATNDEIKRSKRRLIAVETIEAQVSNGVGDAGVLAAIAALGVQTNARIAALGVQTNALVRNLRAREKNRNNQWTAVVVERPGVHEVGVAPATWPASRQHVLQMQAPNIGVLEAQYNLPVGHFAGNNLGIRRNAVLTYLQEG